MNCINCNRELQQIQGGVYYIDMFFKTVCKKCGAEGTIYGNCSSVDSYDKYKYCDYCIREVKIDKIIGYV